MSEAEKKRRAEYKRNRKKWMSVQFYIAIALAAILIFSSIMFIQLNQTVYIDYSESGVVDYAVKIHENDFFEDEWLESGRSYVSSLIDKVKVQFSYTAIMDTENVAYEYTYSIVAQVRIVDDRTSAVIFNPETVILAEQKESVAGLKELKINTNATIDYAEYDKVVKDFVKFYDLDDVSCFVDVTTKITVLGNCPQFEGNTKNEYTSTLIVPLAEQTIKMTTKNSAPAGVTRILACVNFLGKEVFKILTIVFCILTVASIVTLIIYSYVTRNHDINYAIKVKRILNSYKSYIQKIDNVFDTSGYDVLKVSTFTEMLGIRDTIQSPVLMSENEDKTCTTFFIPTNTKLLYVYELKVEDYDEIYGVKTEENTEIA